MSQLSAKPPSGTRDFLPDEMQMREEVLATIKNIYSKNGFMPVDTPAFENIDVLTGKYGDEGDKLIFKILKRGEKEQTGEVDFALRYDLTVPFIRMYSKYHSELPKIFKRYQIGPVWRADRPGKGRYREFYQCDIDIMGSPTLLAEYEVISTLAEVLNTLGIKNFTIKLNSRALLFEWLEKCGIPEELKPQLLISFDKMDKIGLEGVAEEIKQYDLSDTQLESLMEVLSADQRDQALRDFMGASNALAEVDQVINYLKQDNLSLEFDPLLARGLDYYTGVIFEIFAEDFKGSIGSGGRADQLSGMFMKQPVPLVGGSLGIERVFLLLEEKYKQEIAVSEGYYITVWGEEATEGALKILYALRQKGMKAHIDMTGQKIKNQLKMASQLNCRYCVICGPAEKENNKVTLKDMDQGTQETLDLATFIS